MKKAVMIVAVFGSILGSAKKQKDIYVYDQEQNAYILQRAPAEPGDPVPIDDYVPLLAVAALGLIAWYGKQKYAAGQV